MTMEPDQVSERASLRVNLCQGQRGFHSRRRNCGTEVAFVIQRAVNAGYDLERKHTELVVLSAANGNELPFRPAEGPHDVFSALGADHRGAGFERDVRNVQDMVI